MLSGSASELEADLPFWLFVDALDEYVAGLDPRRLASLEDDVRVELARVLPALRGSPTRPARRSRTSATAPTAPCGSCSSAWRRPSRSCSCSTTCTGPIPRRSSCSGALLRRPPAAAVLSVIGARPRQLPDRLASAFERAEPRWLAHPHRARPARARRRGDGSWAKASTPRLADASTSESGGNPFYLEQLARSPR